MKNSDLVLGCILFDDEQVANKIIKSCRCFTTFTFIHWLPLWPWLSRQCKVDGVTAGGLTVESTIWRRERMAAAFSSELFLIRGSNNEVMQWTSVMVK